MFSKRIGGALLLVGVVACGSNGAATDDAVHVRGSVAQELNGPGERAVAIAGDGRWYSTALDANGTFALTLPKASAYRIVITKPSPTGSASILARVTLEGSQGKTVWIRGKDATTVSFGVLRSAGALTTATFEEPEHEDAESEDEAEADDDADEHGEHDSYEACSSSDEKELEPSDPSAAAKGEYGEEDDDKEPACAASDP